MRIKVTIKDTLTPSLKKLADELLIAAAEKAVRECCFMIEQTAKDKCPVGSAPGGDLKKSIQTEVKVEDGRVIGRVFANVEGGYAPYVHEGTGIYAENGNGRQGGWGYIDESGEDHWTWGQKPQPFLQDAVDERMPELKAKMDEVIQQCLKG